MVGRTWGRGVDNWILIFKSLDGVKEETPDKRGIKNLSWFGVIVTESWGCRKAGQPRF